MFKTIGSWFAAPFQILKELKLMNDALERLKADVAEAKTIEQSAITLLNGLSQQIRDNVGDEDALNALADDLDAQNASLADAVAQNTTAPADTTTTSDTPPE